MFIPFSKTVLSIIPSDIRSNKKVIFYNSSSNRYMVTYHNNKLIFESGDRSESVTSVPIPKENILKIIRGMK